jgi:hypothetical protein
MAATNKSNKAKQQSTQDAIPGSQNSQQQTSSTGIECTQQERQLLNYVQSNAQWIVTALTTASSRAGNHSQWSEQQTYLQMATQISQFTGLPQTMSTGIGGPALTRAAGAGSRGS